MKSFLLSEYDVVCQLLYAFFYGIKVIIMEQISFVLFWFACGFPFFSTMIAVASFFRNFK